jgi:hypothetical protein
MSDACKICCRHLGLAGNVALGSVPIKAVGGAHARGMRIPLLALLAGSPTVIFNYVRRTH